MRRYRCPFHNAIVSIIKSTSSLSPHRPPLTPTRSVVRDRLMSSALDPYERRPLPPPPPPPPSSYYARDRSPIRRAPSTPLPPPPSNGYTYERSPYAVPRARDPYADRLPPCSPACT
ncbi:hypothetical protein CRENBAI_014164 [Crenichthys baileyi]|uniref:Uncharacterized protein n=1 Tax=Crenichthys baileyi TaxID=28760 RepID=A0AAV9R0V7_9TELE